MKLKKHILTEDYRGYTRPFPLFNPLLQEEFDDVEKGREVFHARHPGVAIFPDPFIEPAERLPNVSLTALKVVSGRDPFSGKVAVALAAAIKERWNLEIPIQAHDDPRLSLGMAAPLLLIGGADLNPLSMEIAKKYQIGLFCADFPGPGGWGITTYWELERGVAARYVLSCDEETLEIAVQAFLTGVIEEDGKPVLGWIHQVRPGRHAFGYEGNFDAWLARHIQRLPAIHDWMESGCERPYREVFNAFFQHDYSEGLPYNAAFVDTGIDAIRYYQFTGDEKALELFREMMWGFWEYLNSDAPNVYISDLDFRLGTLCNSWNWIEHSPLITSEERGLFRKLLLGAMRMVSDYFRQVWKPKPGPHNHQTFKARSLILGWRYFKRWDLPDLEKWKEDADAVFEAIPPLAFKHRENAAKYEIFIPEHTLVWLEVTGRTPSPEVRGSLAKFAQREWATRDTFLFPLDYGDCDPEMLPNRPFAIAPWLTKESEEEAEVLGMELASGGMFSFEFPSAIKSFPGMTQGATGQSFPGPVGWSRLPFDPLLESKYPLVGNQESRFDKLVWRGGWKPECPYLALEGFGNKTVSHAHNEVNGVLRMNFAGRIWLVSNGYGKGSDTSDAQKAYATRQTGPEEHNMLVVRTEGGACELPPVNALLNDLGTGPVPFAVTELSDYGGVRWRRHVVLIPGAGFLMIDKVEPLDFKAPTVELQWNILGGRTETCRGSRFEQGGVTLLFDHFGTAEPCWEESQITAWRKLVENADYSYTKSMPSHCILRGGQGAFENGKAHYFVSGFWLENSVYACEWDSNEKVLSIDLQNAIGGAPFASDRAWGRIEVQPNSLRIAFR